MNNAVYSNPGQNLCLTLWLQFTLETFNTNSSTRLNSMNLSGVIMSTKKDGHLKKMIFYILRSDIRHKSLLSQVNLFYIIMEDN